MLYEVITRLVGYMDAHYDELRALQEAGDLTGAGRGFVTTTGLVNSTLALYSLSAIFFVRNNFV